MVDREKALILALVVIVVLVPAGFANPRLLLSTHSFSRQVPLVPWQTTITVASNNPVCPAIDNIFNPTGYIATIGGENFTEDLSGRDPGSSWVQFKSVSSQFAILYRTSDLTSTVIYGLICATFFGHYSTNFLVTAQAAFSLSGGNWRVPASGNYALLFPSLLASPIVANETWTVTTIV